jgi:hypothetical protein
VPSTGRPTHRNTTRRTTATQPQERNSRTATTTARTQLNSTHNATQRKHNTSQLKHNTHAATQTPPPQEKANSTQLKHNAHRTSQRKYHHLRRKPACDGWPRRRRRSACARTYHLGLYRSPSARVCVRTSALARPVFASQSCCVSPARPLTSQFPARRPLRGTCVCVCLACGVHVRVCAVPACVCACVRALQM